MDYEYDRTRGISRKTGGVKSVSPISKVTRIKRGDQEFQKSEDEEKQKKPIPKLPDEALRHFDELALEVEELQKELIEENRPFRVAIYLNGEQVLLDIFRIFPNGSEQKLTTKDITDGDFTDWAKMIQEGEGMLFNMEG